MNVHVRVFTIGALGKAAGVSAPTIRYYEQIGLLPRPRRTAGGQRNYDETDLSRLTFIKQCRDFGFGIDQVRVLLGAVDQPGAGLCRDARYRADASRRGARKAHRASCTRTPPGKLREKLHACLCGRSRP